MNWKKIAEELAVAGYKPKKVPSEAKDAFEAGKVTRDIQKKESEMSGLTFDDMTDIRHEEALQDDFEEAFEEALDKRRGKIRDAMGDARGAEEAADAGIEDIRKTAIEMLKSGHDIGDVIRILGGE